MNNNFNQMGQFGGWYDLERYNEQYVQKEKEKKNIKTIGKCCGFAVISYIVISLVIGFISQKIPFISKMYDETPSLLILDIIITFLAIGVPFFLVHLVLKKKKISIELPFSKTKDKKAATYLVMMFLPVMVIGAIIINYISAFFQSLIGIEFTAPVNSINMVGVTETFIGFLAVAVVPAILEEITIRGIIMQPLRKYGDKFAIFTSALLFAYMHGNMVQIPYTIIGGLLLGYLAVVTGSLWPSIILHFINNLYSVVAICTSDNFGDDISAIIVLVMIVLFAIVGIIGVVKYTRGKYNTKLSVKNILSTKEKVTAFLGNIPVIVASILLFFITISNIAF